MSKTRSSTGDREWLYDEVYKYIITRTTYEQTYGTVVQPRSLYDIVSFFAPMSGIGNLKRDSWRGKSRVTKREMIRSTLARLTKDGKIRVVDEHTIDHKNMHGGIRRSISDCRRSLGNDYDGVMRFYAGTNALQAMADALESDQ